MRSLPHPLEILRKHLFFVTLASLTFGQETTPVTDIRLLELKKPIERTITTGEVHLYRAEVIGGQVLDVLVEQRGIDVVVVVTAPDGKELVEVDSPNGSQGPEAVLLIAEATGGYIIKVRPLEKGASGHYTITFNDRRAPTERDRRHFADKVKLAEAQKIENQWWPLYQNGRYAEAIPLAERVLAIRKEVLGPDHPDVAVTLNSLALLYQNTSDYSQAESLFRRSLSIDEKVFGKDHPNLAIVYGNLATLYYDIGDYDQSEGFMKKALELREKAFGKVHPDVALTLHNLARLFQAKGDDVRAEQFCRQALEIYKKVRPPDHPDIARSLDTLAELYRARGDFAHAEPLYQESLAIYEKWGAKGEFWAAHVMSNFANLYQELNNYEKAENLYLRALKAYTNSLGSEHPFVAQVMNNLAHLYKEKGESDRAENLYQQSLGIRKKLLGAQSREYGESLNNLAQIYWRRRDYDRAKALNQQAIVIWEKALGTNHPDVAIAYSNLAVDQASAGDLSGTLTSLIRVNQIEEQNLRLILTTGSEAQKQIYLNKVSANADFALSFNVLNAPADAEAAKLGLTVTLQRKGRALDAMSDQIGNLRRRSNGEDLALLDRLANVRSRLATLLISSGSGLKPETRAREISALETENEQIETTISRSSEDFRVQVQTVDSETVRKALPPGTALVEFVLFRAIDFQRRGTTGEQYAAYVLTPEAHRPQLVKLGEASSIDGLIHRWRLALNDPKSVDVKDIGRSLDEKVMRQVRRLLGPVNHLFISGDGELNLMPFAALVDESNKYLVENHSITYLTSGRDLLRLQSPHNTQSANVLIIADPLFDLASSQQRETDRSEPAPKSTSPGRQNERSADFSTLNYQRLIGAGVEARELSRLWPQATVWTEDRATEAALKKTQPPLILHIATHGFFLPDQSRANEVNDPLKSPKSTVPASLSHRENPLLRSGLILAGVKQQTSGEGEDGVLTAFEMAGLDLWGTKLVVLSACETGLGDVKRGEGVYGLRRALVLAGSESQVMSLWKVSDAGTRDLMIAYYSRLQKGEARTEALRAVQVAMLEGKLTSATSGQGRRRETVDVGGKDVAKNYRHPYYWAAFIQSGDWRNLEGK